MAYVNFCKGFDFSCPGNIVVRAFFVFGWANDKYVRLDLDLRIYLRKVQDDKTYINIKAVNS